LCNSAKVDRLLAIYKRDHPEPIALSTTPATPSGDTECSICMRESDRLARRVEALAEADVQDKLLDMCGHLGSYTDGCKAVVIDSFDIIYG
jgi:hypothetical protein